MSPLYEAARAHTRRRTYMTKWSYVQTQREGYTRHMPITHTHTLNPSKTAKCSEKGQLLHLAIIPRVARFKKRTLNVWLFCKAAGV